MSLKLVDITGSDSAPICPNCSTKNQQYALKQEEELGTDMQKSGGVWRCGHCFHAFRYKQVI